MVRHAASSTDCIDASSSDLSQSLLNRTAGEQLLRSLDGAAEVDPACQALTLRLRHYLDRYNDTPHETLGGDTPRQRWEAGRSLRFPEDHAELYRRFVVREDRSVSAGQYQKPRSN